MTPRRPPSVTLATARDISLAAILAGRLNIVRRSRAMYDARVFDGVRLGYLLAGKTAKVARAIAESGVTKEFSPPSWLAQTRRTKEKDP